MPKPFPGSCPVCSKPLFWDDEHPEQVYCPEKHYSCKAEDFNRLWDKFGAQVERLGLRRASTMYAEKLLKDLRALNVVKRVKAR